MNRAKIEDVLLAMGVPAGIKGFDYIADAVEYIDEKTREISVTKELYPYIAEKRNTTASRAERAIRHAFEVARSPRGNYEAVEKYIGFMDCTNFNSLMMLQKKIKQECGGNAREEIRNKTEKKESVVELNMSITELEIREIFRQELRMALNELKESVMQNV